MESVQVQVRELPAGEVGRRHFELTTVELPDPGPGQVLVRNTWTSVDPGLRLRLRADAPQGYFPAFPPGSAMDGVFAVGVVEESQADGFPVGSTVWHSYGWRSHAVVDSGEVAMNGIASLRRLDVDAVPAHAYLGPLGAMGLTAYAGLHVIDALDDTGTIWVSAGAGAVGNLVCQIAKLSGLRVVASAGSDEKVAWLLDEVGVDAAFNWRSRPLSESLQQAAPEGLGLCFDSVGGTHLEAALHALNDNGRIALCGSISEYEGAAAGPRNLFLATSKNLTLRGFRGSAHVPLLDEMQQRLGCWLAEGRLVHRESIYEGLESAPTALADMLAGRTTGKTLVRL
ncbi:NADP-dependent oxidoreductase [Saccharopolyspora sp. TS4A08]|uniref:NADP-dependent oxidoreductase n=1 Tax=Saccharopolyspora ipomoeae TaxID=3042027 RepID=A0ABT6PR71_9PSEU|nr:NADP-dependent oxidoreductase [Saccharopolyspora sp. TS4A08]MDI2030511.1 NADP-dependent oxidoreductase [Saccharopolyspora sp. TS4A08]